ncbi:M23 family metallopeptidase [uncultured Sulfitobacter sp.]|uniref:M23 family metallopeptidase n=1 Tax=uncultured Sulfitobacter sp. TaxID=191468 RepID=UPI00262B8522|nr:M23 family metallopeptidase [uncultured Sulfitobacter sp.]
MRLRHIVLGTTVAAAAVGTIASRTLVSAPPPDNIFFEAPTALVAPPEPIAGPGVIGAVRDPMSNSVEAAFQMPELPILARPEQDDLAAIVQALAMPPWEATVETGDTLDVLLSRAEMDAQMRAEIALAVAVEYDLRRLRPGHRLSVGFRLDGSPAIVTLTVDDGIRIEVTLDDTIAGRTIAPAASTVERAGQLLVSGSIYASLDRAGVPPRFAVDLAQVLGDTVDFRRDLQGGESLNILWGQPILPDGSEVGQPLLTYAALDLADDRFEIVWSDEDRGRATVYLNGEILRTVAPPVEGARLSSVFGQRKHPIYGNMRMHTGVDYAAAAGTPIAATAPGRVSFIGWRNGYGRVVEIAHGSDTLTRYAHLSAVPEGLTVGNRVQAGEVIGQVGETGTATAPNLHYEVRVDGRPIDPLGEELLASAESLDTGDATAILEATRTRFATTLSEDT